MKFIVTTKETWVQEYEVDAPDPATAKEMVQSGEAEPDPKAFEFSDTNDVDEWKVRPVLDQTENPWLLKEPRTPDQLVEWRRQQIKAVAEILKNVPERFTCDGCGLVGVCKLAFDAYNINGDCLYDK